MKNSAKNKIKALLLSAAAPLLPTHAQAEEATTFMPDLGNNDDIFGETNRSWGKVFKNVAKLDKNGDVKYIASHRSHMSHRSGGGGGGQRGRGRCPCAGPFYRSQRVHCHGERGQRGAVRQRDRQRRRICERVHPLYRRR